MCRRALPLLLLLFGFSRLSLGADSISIKIRQVGLENTYLAADGPTLVSFDIRNMTMDSIPVSVLVDELDLGGFANSVTTSITLPVVLSPGEEQTLHVPMVLLQNNNRGLVLYIEARDVHNVIRGRTGRRIGNKVEGQVIALICSTPEVCREIQQFILLTGSPDEQTHKSQSLRMVQLSDPPSEGWAYSPANTVILAAPAERLSSTQREALELFLRNGGNLICIEDRIADGVSSNPGTNPATSTISLADMDAMNRNISFLELYRSRLPLGNYLRVGNGRLVRLPSIASKEFSTYFRPLGFTPSTPQDVSRLFRKYSREFQPSEESQAVWLMKRLGTFFRFPSFLEMLLWMSGYLLVIGVFNFVILRRFGRPEWAWLTIPAIAIVTSVLLYGASARNRPRNFDLDDMTVYRMDSLSSLATAKSIIRISAPRRSEVQPVVPADWIYSPPRRANIDFFDGPAFPITRLPSMGGFLLDHKWETSLTLRKWSFTELEFSGFHRFEGTVFRDSAGRLHNGTGISFRQAIVADHSHVFLIGAFPAGASVDPGQLQSLSYPKETGRSVSRQPGYPGPPFQFSRPSRDGQFMSFDEARQKQMNSEWDDLQAQPFSLVELLRGWPREGDAVFSETRAVFFGLSDQATLGPSLRDLSPDRKSASLLIVTFASWP